jgi:CHAT domain-containing protein
LRLYRNSRWTPNALSATARLAATGGLPHAAMRMHDERVTAALRSGIAVQAAEALLGRAQALAASHDLVGAARASRLGRRYIALVPDSSLRSQMGLDARLSEARSLEETDPARAEAALDSVLSKPRQIRAVLFLLQALVGRADLRAARGDAEAAMADLDSAAQVMGAQRGTGLSVAYRTSVIEAARGVYDRLVLLRLAAGDTSGALRALERGRVSLVSSTAGRRDVRVGHEQLPSGTVAGDYALIGDTLLIWTFHGSNVRLVRRHVDHARLARAAERVRTVLERRDGVGTVHEELTWLFDELIRPVADRLGPAGSRLVVVADGDIPADLFAVLIDRERGEYLIQRYVLLFAPSLNDVAGTHRRATRPYRTAVIADPAFDVRAYPSLERLPEARVEADSVAALYGKAPVLADAAATRPAVTNALLAVIVVHFAGHATFDNQRPERSYLVLAREHQAADPGALTAAELGRADLHGVDLFVLSACETLRTRGGRTGGFTGFAAALLGAGAGGVVGSSWEVSDRASRRLMIEFHRGYQASGDAAGALRDAQLRLLRSGDPSLRDPSAWAAFRYAGN